MDIPNISHVKNITNIFTQADKEEWFLRDPQTIDPGIKDLVDAINSVDVFVTMNSCQGFLIESESSNHCPRTYVDFYVLNEQYYIADMFLRLLSSKFGSLINCKLMYEPDFDLNEDDEVADNGFINLRYSIEIDELRLDLVGPTYREIVEYVDRFAISIKETYMGDA